jgi:hypothetical protein
LLPAEKENETSEMAHPTRYERVIFAFEGQGISKGVRRFKNQVDQYERCFLSLRYSTF